MSQESSQNAYRGLPESVTRVADRMEFVHHGHKVSKPNAEDLIASNAPVFAQEKHGVKYYYLTSIDSKFTRKKDKPKEKPNIKGKKNKEKKPNKLNSKERKSLFKINRETKLDYETFEKINHIWDKYIGIILKNNPKDSSLRLAKADYHGAKFCVLASLNPSLVGIVGLVVQETRNTFKLINKQNQIRTIPKEGTLFAFGHDNSIYKLNGSHIRLSSHNRSKVKFKSKKLSQQI
ncbi:ribonuclease P protein subunit p29-like [Panonychus citri]|uniref:ribonuclease P protein subunit p29-like n=1 Tax=Panonychus citri TaxID=50023 RepID=UPI002306DD9E|nr:ribonuclease P protein subunit p29-like [Panonychus citri]XP_053211314.1 ribonuclease P protein subunit p29-like [Panonychus citri]